MSLTFELNAEIRTDLGKGASRRLRRTGKIPAVIYGGQEDPVALTIDHNTILHSLEHEAFYSHILTIKIDGKPQQAVLRDLQRHPYKPLISHADFQRVVKGQLIRMNVPLHFAGEDVAPGIKTQGGMMTHHITTIEIECLPTKLPEFIEVDVSKLHVDDVVHLTDLKLPAGVVLVDLMATEDMSEEELADVNQPVVAIHAKKVGGEEDEDEDEDASVAEGGEEAASEE